MTFTFLNNSNFVLKRYNGKPANIFFRMLERPINYLDVLHSVSISQYTPAYRLVFQS